MFSQAERFKEKLLAKIPKEKLLAKIPEEAKNTAFVQLFGIMKVPMIFYVRPRILELNEKRCVIKIPLSWRTRNHLNSMYFGALAVGADVAGGLIAMKAIQDRKAPVSLVFKDFHAEFLKRAEGDVLFKCDDGEKIIALLQKAMDSGERVSTPVHVTATVPSKSGEDPVAKLVLTLSLKKKTRR
jgi:acyl-coenzyme A thioesterase PaaI-like protein